LAEGGDGSEKEVETGFMMSGFPTDFAMHCGIIDSNNEQNDDGDKDRKIESEITEVSNPGKDASEKKVENGFMMSEFPTDFTMYCGFIDSNNETNGGADKDRKIKSENTKVSDPGKESPEKVNPQSDASLSTSLLSEAIDGISSSYDELKATLASRRLNEHKTPQDYQHSTPPSPVKYVLDYTLNRFTRWLRILGIDAVLETIEQEHERTHGGNIAIFDRCKNEHRTLITTSYKLMLRKGCPPGTYLLDPKSTSYLLEQVLPRLLRTHGVELSPCTFLTRCVVCNGNIHRVHTEEDKRAVFGDHGAADLIDSEEEMDVFRCDGCRQGYWWGDSPTSSASRVFNQATKLLRVCLRGGVELKDENITDEKKRKALMGAFDFVDVAKERQSGESIARETYTELSAIEWLREDKLSNPFHLKSAYAAHGETVRDCLPFTNVTKEFVGCLDYIFFEPLQFDQICRLKVPTSFREMNASGARQGHLIPSDIWPSDHIAVGARLRLKPNGVADGSNKNGMPIATADKNVNNDTAEPAPHPDRCACGCVPNVYSLFEMAELRKKAREKKKAEAASKLSN